MLSKKANYIKTFVINYRLSKKGKTKVNICICIYLYLFECLQINVCVRRICSKIIKPKNKKNYYLQGKDKIGQSGRARS